MLIQYIPEGNHEIEHLPGTPQDWRMIQQADEGHLDLVIKINLIELFDRWEHDRLLYSLHVVRFPLGHRIRDLALNLADVGRVVQICHLILLLSELE